MKMLSFDHGGPGRHRVSLRETVRIHVQFLMLIRSAVGFSVYMRRRACDPMVGIDGHARLHDRQKLLFTCPNAIHLGRVRFDGLACAKPS